LQYTDLNCLAGLVEPGIVEVEGIAGLAGEGSDSFRLPDAMGVQNPSICVIFVAEDTEEELAHLL